MKLLRMLLQYTRRAAVSVLLVGLAATHSDAVEVVGVDASPEEEVAWYIDTWRHHWDIHADDERHRAAQRIWKRIQERPEVYYPHFEQALWNSRDLYEEAAAIHSLGSPPFVDRYRERVREIFLSYVKGDYRSPHESLEDFAAINEVLVYFSQVAESDDARELLPYVSQPPNRRASLSAIEAISQIASPDILPELEAAVQRHAELYPESFSNVEMYLEHEIPQLRKEILKRYPNYDAQPGTSSVVATEPNSTRESIPQESETARSMLEASESESESSSFWFGWLLGGLLVTALAAVAFRLRR